MPIKPLSDETSVTLVRQLRAYAEILEGQLQTGSSREARRALAGASMAIRSLREHWTE